MTDVEGVPVRVQELGADDVVRAARTAHLFDDPLDDVALRRFLEDPRHHLLIASVDDAPAGMITAVELLHPDKPRPEMFLYEMGVDPGFRRRGVASALLQRLLELCHERGCGDLFVLTDEANEGAIATYGKAGGAAERGQLLFTWDLPGSDPT